MSTDQKKLCQRCKRYFILSDLFNHVCEDEDGDVNNVTIKKHENESYNNRNIKVPLDKLSSTDNKSFNKQSTSSLFNNDQENEHTKYEFDPSTLFSSSQNHYHSNDSPTPSAASSRLSSSSRLSTSSGGNKFSDFTKYQPQNMTKLNRRSSFNPTRTPTPTTTGRQTSRMNISSTKHDNSYSRNNGTKLSSTVNHKNEPVYHIPVMLKRSRSPFHSTGRPSMTNTRTATPTPSPATSTSRFSYSKVDPFPPGVTRVSNYAEPRTTTSPRASSVAYVYIRNPSAVRA
ncbi:unnamed protein product [Didymodactylos carnosus]|uniref:Uncharacterized protein n=1 Tax=Didymodactylos carnosus TaxID=1234261 RepID=A0A813SJL4_9BILA|nr:unnamed protein product [Didymodactylos carnosus]CAF0852156.1 unnamed protein product [Didymodactylos carnosus]CAF3582762.1 unnamed protein product [Didymodactylos carnosus]CAF3637358.1 unnamed protein product [Didymodactylos carnosus]